MSRTIWKFEVPVTDHPQVEMPVGAKVLDVQASPKRDLLWLWALVEPEAEKTTKEFLLYGTGHPVDPELTPGEHIATVQVPLGPGHLPLVWHLFSLPVPF